ncbi:hypothetical protein SUDANB176_06388 [Streptomyces sp. enrichment culture]
MAGAVPRYSPSRGKRRRPGSVGGALPAGPAVIVRPARTARRSPVRVYRRTGCRRRPGKSALRSEPEGNRRGTGSQVTQGRIVSVAHPAKEFLTSARG